MTVSKELLRQMLDTYGGIPMDDEELEEAAKTVEDYLKQVATAADVDTSQVYSGRTISLPQPPK